VTGQDCRSLARNIVNQVADLYHESIPSGRWVKVRQETNDMLDDWVSSLLLEHCTANPQVGELEVSRSDAVWYQGITHDGRLWIETASMDELLQHCASVTEVTTFNRITQRTITYAPVIVQFDPFGDCGQ
jgi:hypothetical protein